MKQIITGSDFKDMIITASAALEAEKQAVNELNVFPVPDGDTGTNMSMTIGAATAELLSKEVQTVSEAADITASAMLRGARGNSGVILSLLFRGISKRLKKEETADGPAIAEALQRGVDAAYKAVMKPAEGTVLTVSRMAAGRAIEASAENADLEYVMDQCLLAAEEALKETVNQNPVLKKANVIDAGGRGFVIILSGMISALKGEVIRPAAQTEASSGPKEAADFTEFDTEEIKYTYCTEMIIDRNDPNSDVETLRAYLDSIGDSLVLVDDEEIIKVHVHSNEPNKVLEKGLTYGPLAKIKIENMKVQHTQKMLDVEQPKTPIIKERIIREPEKKYGFVAVCAGEGLTGAFQDLGADAVISGGQTMNPSTEDILAGIDETPAEIVYVFPNNKNIIMAAEQTTRLSTQKKVIVVPTTSVPQGISALMSFDESVDEEENTQNMTEAASAVKTCLITYAARNSNFDDRKIRKGDYLGMLEGKLVSNERNLMNVIKALAEQIPEEGVSFLTVISGEEASEKNTKEIVSYLEQTYPDAEVNVLAGGQPVYYYMISAE